MLPHSASADLMPVPVLRDALCRKPRDFITPAGKVFINWPRRLLDAVEVDEADGLLYPTEVFERHARDYRNWTFSREFVGVFPELGGLVEMNDY